MITEEINKILKEWDDKTPSDVGVGYAFKQTGGVYNGEVCVSFSVKEKKPLSELSEDEVLPSEIYVNDDLTIKTDVIQVGEIYTLQCSRTTPITANQPCESFILTPPTNRSAFATLKGGISITSVNQSSGVGTLGMIVQDVQTNALVGLTNNHVVVGNAVAAQYQNLNPYLGNNFPPTNEVLPNSNFSCQPGESGYQTNLKFGQVVRYVPMVPNGALNLTNGGSSASPSLVPKNRVDGALVSIDCNKIDFNQSWKFSGFESLMTAPLPFATTAELDNLMVTNPQLYSTGRSTGPKGLGTPGCELRLFGINQSQTINGFRWHVSGGVQYGTGASFDPRLIAFYKPSGNAAQPHCLWPCAGGDSGSMLIANFGTQNSPNFKVIGLVFAGNSSPSYPNTWNDNNGCNVFTCSYSPYSTWLGYACRIDDVANQLGIKAWTGGTAPLVNPQSINVITLPGLSPITATTCQNSYYYQIGTTMTQNSCGGANFGAKSILVQSPNFINGQTPPWQAGGQVIKHPLCGGQNVNFAFFWSLTDFTTNDVISYSLLMEDINAVGTSPSGYFVHWKVTNIVPTQTSINVWQTGPTGWLPGATIQLTDWSPNAVNPNGYGGPCVAGHTYRLSITAFLNPAAGGGTVTSNYITFNSI
jgi:phosphatidylethanolamine-binding protein (PEBP) family uncharacterized protein